MGKTLSIQNVNKSFTVDGQKVDVLKDINLEIREGEFIAIVGHSGCGKSTLLKIIAGLEKNDTGLVTVDGNEVKGPGMDRGMIFQEHRLFPWMSIEKNVQLGLKWPGQRGKNKTFRSVSGTCEIERVQKSISESAFRWYVTACCYRKITGEPAGNPAP